MPALITFHDIEDVTKYFIYTAPDLADNLLINVDSNTPNFYPEIIIERRDQSGQSTEFIVRGMKYKGNHLQEVIQAGYNDHFFFTVRFPTVLGD